MKDETPKPPQIPPAPYDGLHPNTLERQETALRHSQQTVGEPENVAAALAGHRQAIVHGMAGDTDHFPPKGFHRGFINDTKARHAARKVAIGDIIDRVWDSSCACPFTDLSCRPLQWSAPPAPRISPSS